MVDIEKQAIERIKMASDMSLQYFKKPVTVCYSGGKDSEVIVNLSIKSKAPFIIQHSHTTIDAPQTVYHVHEQFKRWENDGHICEIKYPKQSFWALLARKTTPPTRQARYCCEEQKEFANHNNLIITGVRWNESRQRKSTRGVIESNSVKRENRIILMNDNDDKRQLIDRCIKLNLTTVNPIIDWTNSQRDEYIQEYHLHCNPLYCMGFRRIGCIGCPLASQKQRYFEFNMFPKYKQMYMRSFEKMLLNRQTRERAGLSNYSMKFRTAKDIFRFFMEEKEINGQIDFDDIGAKTEFI